MKENRENMMTGDISGRITENSVRDIWRFRRYRERELFTEDGEPLTIIYPGRPNNSDGADFTDAVIYTGGELLTGDVELHVYSGDWRNHGHHLNKEYNRVVLHAVMWHKPEKQTVLQNGKTVPVLALDKFTEIPAAGLGGILPEGNISIMPCNPAFQNNDIRKTAVKLDRMGDARFYEKAERFLSEIKSRGAGETIYRGIMESLGYSGNKSAFTELSGLLPLSVLEKEKRYVKDSYGYLLSVQSLLLGTAGFLNPEIERPLDSAGIGPETVERLRKLWTDTRPTVTVNPDLWRLFRIRPGNSPVRRLIAMSYLLQRYRKDGLLPGLLALVSGAVEEQSCRVITDGLTISPGSRVEEKSGSDREPDKSAMLGKSRAGEIAVNVLLPYYYAWGNIYHGHGQGVPALEIYRSFPRNPENSLVRHMKEQLALDSKDINTARRQQGLIHVYKNFCTRGMCGECGLGEFKSGRDIETHPVVFTGIKTKETAGSYHCRVVGA